MLPYILWQMKSQINWWWLENCCVLTILLVTFQKNVFNSSYRHQKADCQANCVSLMLQQGQICAFFSHFSFWGLGVCLPVWCHCAGKAQQSVWTHQRNSCDSAVPLFSVPSPLHCCHFFYLHTHTPPHPPTHTLHPTPPSYSESQGQTFQRDSHFSSSPSSGGCRGEWQINRLSSPWLWSECGWGGEKREKCCFWALSCSPEYRLSLHQTNRTKLTKFRSEILHRTQDYLKLNARPLQNLWLSAGAVSPSVGIEFHSWKQVMLATLHTKSSGSQGKGSVNHLAVLCRGIARGCPWQFR